MHADGAGAGALRRMLRWARRAGPLGGLTFPWTRRWCLERDARAGHTVLLPACPAKPYDLTCSSLCAQGHPYHTAGLTCLDIHPDSTAVISGSEDGVPKVGGAGGGWWFVQSKSTTGGPITGR